MAAGHLKSLYQLRRPIRALVARKAPQKVFAEAQLPSKLKQPSKPKLKQQLRPRQPKRLKQPSSSSKPPHKLPRRAPTHSASLKHTLASSKR